MKFSLVLLALLGTDKVHCTWAAATTAGDGKPTGAKIRARHVPRALQDVTASTDSSSFAKGLSSLGKSGGGSDGSSSLGKGLSSLGKSGGGSDDGSKGISFKGKGKGVGPVLGIGALLTTIFGGGLLVSTLSFQDCVDGTDQPISFSRWLFLRLTGNDPGPCPANVATPTTAPIKVTTPTKAPVPPVAAPTNAPVPNTGCPEGFVYDNGTCKCPPGLVEVPGPPKSCVYPPPTSAPVPPVAPTKAPVPVAAPTKAPVYSCPDGFIYVDGTCTCPSGKVVIDGKCCNGPAPTKAPVPVAAPTKAPVPVAAPTKAPVHSCPDGFIYVDGTCTCPSGKVVIDGKCCNGPAPTKAPIPAIPTKAPVYPRCFACDPAEKVVDFNSLPAGQFVSEYAGFNLYEANHCHGYPNVFDSGHILLDDEDLKTSDNSKLLIVQGTEHLRCFLAGFI
jgi:hypothetical protein